MRMIDGHDHPDPSGSVGPELAGMIGKRILLLGYGIEGKATERYLRSKLSDLEIGITDRANGDDYLEQQREYDIAIRSPGIPKRLVTIPYTTATNMFFSEVRGRTIGVTGTKGKSTTSSLIHHILATAGKKTHLVGNIGTAMLDGLLASNEPDDIFVVELSSYQLDDIRYAPDIAVIVSLYNDHQDYHGGLEHYHEAKRNIIRNLGPHGLFVYNPAFPKLSEWAEQVPSMPYAAFEVAEGDTQLVGAHNHDNIRAAITVVRELGVDDATIRTALKTFRPLRHRLQNVGTYRGITFYDDAISTTPESSTKALEALPTVGTIMVGGLDRGYDFEAFAKELLIRKIPNIVFFPPTGEKIRAILKAKGRGEDGFLSTTSMEEAVRFAYDHTPAGTVCLLSTASPSYSVWKNFEEKGDQFQHWVHHYAEESHQENREIAHPTTQAQGETEGQSR